MRAAGSRRQDDNWVVTSPRAGADGRGKVNNWALETVPQPGLNGRIGISRAAKTRRLVRIMRCL